MIFWALMLLGPHDQAQYPAKERILLTQKILMIKPIERARERETERWRRSGGEKWRQWHQWVFRLQQYFLQLRSSGYAPFCLSLLMENSVRVFVGYLFCSLLFVFGLLLTLLGIELHLLFRWLSSVKCPILFESPMDWNLSLSCALSHLTHLHFF